LKFGFRLYRRLWIGNNQYLNLQNKNGNVKVEEELLSIIVSIYFVATYLCMCSVTRLYIIIDLLNLPTHWIEFCLFTLILSIRLNWFQSVWNFWYKYCNQLKRNQIGRYNLPCNLLSITSFSQYPVFSIIYKMAFKKLCNTTCMRARTMYTDHVRARNYSKHVY
jgi:hypothetical protein